MSIVIPRERPASMRGAPAHQPETSAQARALECAPAPNRQIIVSNRLPTAWTWTGRAGSPSRAAQEGWPARSGRCTSARATSGSDGRRTPGSATRPPPCASTRRWPSAPACRYTWTRTTPRCTTRASRTPRCGRCSTAFPRSTRFDQQAWEAYVRVNERFCDAVVGGRAPGRRGVGPGLPPHAPARARARGPARGRTWASFLHVPFPDYETFRMLPWRAELRARRAGRRPRSASTPTTTCAISFPAAAAIAGLGEPHGHAHRGRDGWCRPTRFPWASTTNGSATPRSSLPPRSRVPNSRTGRAMAAARSCCRWSGSTTRRACPSACAPTAPF